MNPIDLAALRHSKLEVITDYGPDTEEELVIKGMLAALRQSYEKDAKPLVDRLVQIHASKMPKMFLVPNSTE